VQVDVLAELWLHVHAGKAVTSIAGLVEVLVRRVWSHRRRQHRWLQFSDEVAGAATASPGRTPAAAGLAREAEVTVSLRGTRQRWLIARVRDGASCEQIAEELGWPVGEVARQLRRLAAQLAEGRRRT
jgi:DNA-directed RNA polymerase specialized sigma24 family protein